jgi:hypothetical protein
MIKYYDNIADENKIDNEVEQNIRRKNKICKIVFFTSLVLWIVILVVDLLFNGFVSSSETLLKYVLYFPPAINMLTIWTLMEYFMDKRYNQ